MLNFRGMRFAIDVILVCICRYAACLLSYRHLEEIIAATQVVAAINVGAFVNAVARISVVAYEFNPARSVVGQTRTTDDFAEIKALRNLQITSFAAEISGRKDVAAESLRRTVNDEIIAVIAAAEEIGLINFPHGTRTEIINEMKKLVHESVGLKG